MAEAPVRTEKQLSERIAFLRSKSEVLEKQISSRSGDLLGYVRQPSKLFREWANDITSEGNFGWDMLKVVMRFFTRFFGRSRHHSEAKPGGFNTFSAILDFLASRRRTG